jgi:hypothetical protein
LLIGDNQDNVGTVVGHETLLWIHRVKCNGEELFKRSTGSAYPYFVVGVWIVTVDNGQICP